jgi:hypothetical protein
VRSVLLLLLWLGATTGQVRPPVRAQVVVGASLTVLRGSVGVLRSDGTPISPAASGLALGPGDQIATLGRSSALVTFFEGSELELGGTPRSSSGISPEMARAPPSPCRVSSAPP